MSIRMASTLQSAPSSLRYKLTAGAVAIGVLGLGVAVLSRAPTSEQTAADYKTWRHPTGGSPDSSNFTSLTGFSSQNINQLEVAWTYPTQDKQSWKFSPIVIGATIYGFAHDDHLVALNATTGAEIWRHAAPPGTAGMRGFNYWESRDGSQKRLLLAGGTDLFAVDASTGALVSSFGDKGRVDLREGLGRDPETITRLVSRGAGRVFENLIILGSSTGEGYGSPPGDIRAFDIVTGKLAWTFHTVPRPGEFGYESNPAGAWKYLGASNHWGDMSLDEKRGIVYIPTGSPSYDFYGADRQGDNLYGNSLIALNARTGKRVWHFQTIHHDLGDYDLVSAPQLITINHDGKRVDAVAQAGKIGFLYVFNRETGKPIWPIVERPVPRSTVPGEHDSPTQPFPTVVPPFARQKFTAADINPHLSPKDRAEVLSLLKGARNDGLFTPPELGRFSVQMPGHSGGSALGGTSANPNKGLVYIVSFDGPAFLKLVPKQADTARTTYFGPLVSEIGGCEGVCVNEGPEALANKRRRISVPPPTQAEIARGNQVYGERCSVCHGDNRQGGTGPSLVDVSRRLNERRIAATIEKGAGQMPPMGSVVSGADQKAVIAFLKGPDAQPQRSAAVPSNYPAGFKRLFSGYGFHPTAVSPPWSTLTAYDLNTGTIKWQIPYGSATGVDPADNNYGLLQFHSPKAPVIVTATGLLLSATADRKLRAYDAETGKVIWTRSLPDRAMGNPAVYELNGRQFLLVVTRGAYVAYALPAR